MKLTTFWTKTSQSRQSETYQRAQNVPNSAVRPRTTLVFLVSDCQSIYNKLKQPEKGQLPKLYLFLTKISQTIILVKQSLKNVGQRRRVRGLSGLLHTRLRK